MLGLGDLLGERYRLDERIAAGGMGDVWRATDLVLGRVVAVKVVSAALLTDPAFSARFRAEARLLAAFRHPGVVDVYDYGESAQPVEAGEEVGNEAAYLVMAYVEGEPLSARIAAAGRLSVAETANVIAQAARALHAAHENGIIHRDVKPGNLLIQPDGTVILVDFGVAYSADVTRLTGVNDVLGTALYMAPEQVSKQSITPATDVYALGAVAYHCLAGQPPFTGDNALSIALRHLEDEAPPLPPDVPAPIRAVIARAMAKNPAERYPSAAAFAAAIEPTRQATAVEAGQRGAAAFAIGRVSQGYAGPQLAAPADAAPVGAATRTFPSAAPAPSRNLRRWVLPAAIALAVLVGLAALAATLIPSGDGGSDGGPGQVPSSSQTAAPHDTRPAEVGNPGTGKRTANPSGTPATTATAPGAGNSPSRPAASRTPSQSPSPAAPQTSQPASPGDTSTVPSATSAVNSR